MLYYIMIYYTISYFTILYYNILYYTILYYSSTARFEKLAALSGVPGQEVVKRSVPDPSPSA